MKVTIQTKTGAFSFECGSGETLLYAGLRNGLALPYECATGTCGSAAISASSAGVSARPLTSRATASTTGSSGPPAANPSAW